MNQNFQFQQKQIFQCKDHPQEPAQFWCKQSYCQENRVFCIVCQKEKSINSQHEDSLRGKAKLNLINYR
ncbi:unnamed protein product [Paramecium sonneborni]|uniref:Uncharacterized protein n=1 Tax=Paramecium sonneborni TaxID=65129 RepID=A0A8S1N4E7_9CILI|nr:unnamed protein product [Paramecium sonneborni]